MDTSEWPERSEVSVLATILLEPSRIHEALDLDPRDFWHERHASIFAAVAELHDAGRGVTPVTIIERLEKHDPQIPHYLADLLDEVPYGAPLKPHVMQVQRYAARRRLLASMRSVLETAAGSGDLSASELSTMAMARILEASGHDRSLGWTEPGSIVGEVIEQIGREAAGDEPPGTPSMLPKLNRMTGGYHAGDLVVVAGRPSMGKTALALQEAAQAAKQGKAVYIASLEMSTPELTRRMLAQIGGVDLVKVRERGMSPEASKGLARAAELMERLPIWIDDRPGESVADLRASLHRASATQRPQMIVVDYIQLMEGGGENRTQQVAQISRALKKLAREFEAPVLALSQLSRAVEHRSPPRPQLSDLRDSGAIEQDADLVLMLWRPEYYLTDEDPQERWAELQGKAELVVPKQRRGPTGAVQMRWDKTTTTFTEAMREPQTGGVPWQT